MMSGRGDACNVCSTGTLLHGCHMYDSAHVKVSKCNMIEAGKEEKKIQNVRRDQLLRSIYFFEGYTIFLSFLVVDC